jgi:hypothetical protein
MGFTKIRLGGLMKKIALIVAAIILSVAFLGADVYIKTKTHTDPFEMMGKSQPAKDEVQEQWIGDNKFAAIQATQRIILDLDKKMMYVVYPKTESYVETQLPLDMAKLLPEQVAQMMSMMKMTVKVTPSGQTKTIGKWKCNGYDIDIGMMMMNMKMTSWATTDVPFDWEMYSSKLLPAIMKSSGQMFLDDDSMNEFKKIKGFQVASEMTMNMMGQNIRVTSEVLEISKKTAPKGTYTVPGSYSKQDKLTIRQGFQ